MLDYILSILIYSSLPLLLALTLFFIKDPAKKIKRLKHIAFAGLLSSFIFFNLGMIGTADCGNNCTGGIGTNDVYAITAIAFMLTVVVPFAIYMLKKAAANSPVRLMELVKTIYGGSCSSC